MKKQIFIKSIQFIGRILELLGKTLLITILYMFRGVKIISQSIEATLEFICLKSNILMVISTPEENQNEYEEKYCETDIKIMAEKLPKEIYNIIDIASFYKISYRQARKIKDYMNIRENSPNIHKQYSV